MEIQRKSTRSNGALFVPQNQLEVWDFKISKSSIMLCWLNRFGVLFIKKIY